MAAALAVAASSLVLTACSHSSQYLPKGQSSTTAGHSRHVRDTGGLPIIGGVTSVSSFNAIYASAGANSGLGTDQQVIDIGSIKGGGGSGVGVATPTCTDPNDQCPVDSCDPSDADCVQLQVAVQPGLPAGPCVQTDGSNSLPIGTTLGSVNKSGVVSVRSVVDVNQVNGLAFNSIVSPTTVISDWVSVGWIYLDQNGGRWFQKDPLAQWTTTINFNVNAYFGLSVTPPLAQNPVYISVKPTVTSLSDGLQTVKCWAQGRALVPGVWS
jgi:hypothetical protein